MAQYYVSISARVSVTATYLADVEADSQEDAERIALESATKVTESIREGGDWEFGRSYDLIPNTAEVYDVQEQTDF